MGNGTSIGNFGSLTTTAGEGVFLMSARYSATPVT
jgi:hypothetical protein